MAADLSAPKQEFCQPVNRMPVALEQPPNLLLSGLQVDMRAKWVKHALQNVCIVLVSRSIMFNNVTRCSTVKHLLRDWAC
jgi:hypothetical protein